MARYQGFRERVVPPDTGSWVQISGDPLENSLEEHPQVQVQVQVRREFA